MVAVGELNPDLVLARIAADAPRLGTEQEATSYQLTLGSSTAICIVGMQRLGLRTALVARVGDDDFGRFCTDFLKRERVGVQWIQRDEGVATGLTVALAYPTDRLLATYPGAMETLTAEDVPDEALRAARHLHVSSFFLQRALQPGLAPLFKRARALGLTTSLDTGWDPADTWDLAHLRPALAHTDVFLPNEIELARLSRGASMADGAAWALAQGASTVVVKRGGDGGSAFTTQGRVDWPAYEIEVVDTTGAGDSFDAGYLYGHLAGWQQSHRLRLANACGALAAAAVGGTGGSGSLEHVRAFLEARGEPGGQP